MCKNGGFPKIVYKYRSWKDENHKNLLFKNQIKLSSPKDFNDPFDCRIPDNLSELNTTKKRELFVNKCSEGLLEKYNEDILNKKKIELFQKLENNLEDAQRSYNKLEFADNDQYFAIFSCSIKWDNIIMWSHYADNHYGFCVGFNEEKLRESGHFRKEGYMFYKNKYPSIDPLSNFTKKWSFNEKIKEWQFDPLKTLEKSFTKTNTKAKEWKYEAEYRLMDNKYPIKLNDNERIVSIKNNCFAEIILGLNFSETDKALIRKIAEEKQIPVYQTIKVPSEFKLDRIKIF